MPAYRLVPTDKQPFAPTPYSPEPSWMREYTPPGLPAPGTRTLGGDLAAGSLWNEPVYVEGKGWETSTDFDQAIRQGPAVTGDYGMTRLPPGEDPGMDARNPYLKGSEAWRGPYHGHSGQPPVEDPRGVKSIVFGGEQAASRTGGPSNVPVAQAKAGQPSMAPSDIDPWARVSEVGNRITAPFRFVRDYAGNVIQQGYEAASVPSQFIDGTMVPSSDPRAATDAALEVAPLMMGGSFRSRPVSSVESGITGYHASPNVFAPEPGAPLGRFDSSRIGTTIGPQAFGHGHYFGGTDSAAGYYRGMFNRNIYNLDRTPTSDAWGRIVRNGESKADVLSEYQKLADDKTLPQRTRKYYQDSADSIVSGAAERYQPPRSASTYEAKLNVDPEKLIDWHKPLSEQAQVVQDFAKLRDLKLPADATMRQFYDALGEPAAASKALLDAGIPGVKYLDESSRLRGQTTPNYVMFGDQDIRIDRKYGVGGAIAVAVGAGYAGTAEAGQPFNTTLPDPVTEADRRAFATHNPNLEPQYRPPMQDIPTGRDIQNQYDPGATIRPGQDEGGPAPAYGDPSPWNRPPPPVGVEGGAGWSYSGQRKPFIQNPMGGQITVPVYRTPLGQRSDTGYDLHEVGYTPVFPEDLQTASAPPKMIDPYMEAVKLNAPQQAIPIQGNPNWQMSAYGNPTSQQTDDRFSFTPTQALNIYQPMSNTNGVPTYG